MKFKSSSPQFLRFWNPLIDVIKKLGGSGNPQEVTDAVIEYLKISEKELEETYKSGVSKIENQIAWTRSYLVKAGFLDSSQRGIWSLTDKAYKIKYDDAKIYQTYREIQQGYLKKALNAKNNENKKIEEEVTNDSEKIPIQEKHRLELLEVLKNLDPVGFERLCQRLLREAGFQKVVVTKRSRDGGIDGEGILEVNKLLNFKVMFQCKRHKENNAITSEMIQQFKGALDTTRTDKGIYITTSRFTKDAKSIAEQGSIPIQLVDGEMLVSMFEEFKLGLKPVTIFEIDYNFFEEFK